MAQSSSPPRTQKWFRHLPNALTWFRMVSAVFIYATLFLPAPWGAWTAAGVFGVCAVTDVLDGWLARRLKAQSVLGTVLDPIADKMLVLSALLVLVQRGVIGGEAWEQQLSLIAAFVIVWREILVAGLREYLAQHEVSLPVTGWAKAKTFLQMVAIAFLLAMPPLEQYLTGIWMAMQVLLWAAALLGVASAAAYVRSSMRQYRERKVAEPAEPETKSPEPKTPTSKDARPRALKMRP